MKTNKVINRLAFVAALVIIFGVGSAANQAFACTAGNHLISDAATALQR